MENNQLDALHHEVRALRMEIEGLKMLLMDKPIHQDTPSKGSLDSKISEFLLDLRIPANIKGFVFLREAIKMSYEDFDAVDAIGKCIYPVIADKYHTTVSRVERAIRHAIESSWRRYPDHPFYKGYFPDKPTNGHFVAMIADQFLLEAAAK